MRSIGIPQKGAATARDWTQGSILGNLLSLAWPMMVTGGLVMIGPTIDLIWVGQLGAAAVAGVGVSGTIVLLVQSMTMGLNMGLRAIVARLYGAGDTEGANHAVRQSLTIAAVYAVIMATVGILLAEPILEMMGMAPDVVSQGAPYLRINFMGMVTMTFFRSVESTMQGSGDSTSPMRITIFFRLFHIALCPFLVFGWWFFPRLGVSGAALTQVFSQGVGAALGFWFLFSGRTRVRLTLKNYRVDFDMMWRILKVALPASVTAIERQFAQLLLMGFMSPFGTFAVAGHTLNQRIDMFLQTPSGAMGTAAGVLAGQNLGARRPDRAEKTGWVGVWFLSACMLVASVAIFIWAESIVRVFSSDPGVVEVSTVFLQIASTGYFVMGMYSVLQQCVNGTGNTMIAMVVSLVAIGLIQVPLAWVLPHYLGMGANGVRWAIVITSVTEAIFYIIFFRSGKWKNKKI